LKRVLVDTSIWIKHFRGKDRTLENLLKNDRVLVHPYIMGELLLGNLKKNSEVYRLLESLELCKIVSLQEVLELISIRGLSGTGIGWVDATILSSAVISKCLLYTDDNNLKQVLKSKVKEAVFSH